MSAKLMPPIVMIHRMRLPVKGSAHIYQNDIVCADTSDNTVTPAATSTTLKVAGLAHEEVDNSAGGDGDKLCDVEFLVPKRCFALKNDTGTALTSADLFDVCYWKDAETVTGDSTGASKAGRFWGFYSHLGATLCLVEPIDVPV